MAFLLRWVKWVIILVGVGGYCFVLWYSNFHPESPRNKDKRNIDKAEKILIEIEKKIINDAEFERVRLYASTRFPGKIEVGGTVLNERILEKLKKTINEAIPPIQSVWDVQLLDLCRPLIGQKKGPSVEGERLKH